MRKPSPTFFVITDLTTSLLSENNVSLSEKDKGQHVSSTDVNPVQSGTVGQCVSSQLAEGRCLTVASGASSLAKMAVEELSIMPSKKLNGVSEASAPHMWPTVIGTVGSVVTVGLVALVSIVAIVSDNGIPPGFPMDSNSQVVEIEIDGSKEVTK